MSSSSPESVTVNGITVASVATTSLGVSMLIVATFLSIVKSTVFSLLTYTPLSSEYLMVTSLSPYKFVLTVTLNPASSAAQSLEINVSPTYNSTVPFVTIELSLVALTTTVTLSPQTISVTVNSST